MPCTRCDGICVNDQFYDRIDEQGQLHVGVWRWASRCPMCGTMVYERAESRAIDAAVRIDRTNSMPLLRSSTPPDDYEGGRHALSGMSSCDDEYQ
jgi:hypothetical protein